jgi:hypothetical protein
MGFFEMCAGVSLIILVSAFARRFIRHGGTPSYHTVQVQAPAKPAPRQLTPAQIKALETYERLAKDKMDVIKTALAMGYHEDDLARLDARLEKLIGKDKLQDIVGNPAGSALHDSDLEDTSIASEIDRLQRMRQSR